MSGTSYTWLVAVHAQLAVLGLAVLLHPLVTMRLRGGVPRNTLLTADLAAILLGLAFGLGWFVYPTYRELVKPAVYLSNPGVVLRFETKEHLAAIALGLIIAGTLTLRASGRRPAGKEAAWSLLLCGWFLALTTALLGVFVHGRAHPAF